MASGNGNSAHPNFPLSSLAGSQPVKKFEHFRLEVNSLDQVLSEIRRAGGTGSLTINFAGGRPRGAAEWKQETTNR